MLCRCSRVLSSETRASSPARLRLSSARRSLDLSQETGASSAVRRRLSSALRSSVGAALTEGEPTDADASCWRRDDRGLDLVEPKCAMPSSWSTSSHHCLMAPGEAMELGGGVATPWLQTMPLGLSWVEFGMSAQLDAAVQRAQQQRLALGGWQPVAWKKQLLPPPGNPLKSRRGAQRFAPSC
jgi:hypothetical protein